MTIEGLITCWFLNPVPGEVFISIKAVVVPDYRVAWEHSFFNEAVRPRRVNPEPTLNYVHQSAIAENSHNNSIVWIGQGKNQEGRLLTKSSYRLQYMFRAASSSRTCRTKNVTRVISRQSDGLPRCISVKSRLSMIPSSLCMYNSSWWPSWFCIIRGTGIWPFQADPSSRTADIPRVWSLANCHPWRMMARVVYNAKHFWIRSCRSRLAWRNSTLAGWFSTHFRLITGLMHSVT